jgi:hypothetical protein
MVALNPKTVDVYDASARTGKLTSMNTAAVIGNSLELIRTSWGKRKR